MKVVTTLVSYVTHIPEKELNTYKKAFLGITTLLTFGIIYYAYSSSSAHLTRIEKLHKDAQTSAELIVKNEKIEREQERIKGLLAKNANFSLESFFEEFCKKHSLRPEPGWNTTINPIEGSENFDEIILPATFKNQTTQTLVSMLDDLDKNELVYIKELAITREEQKIMFTLELATKKQRKEFT